MFDSSKLTVRDIILMCTAFSLRFNISDQALLMLLSMFQFCAGPEFSSLNLSKHMMAKCFSSQNENVTYHYYCTFCSERIIFLKAENNPTKKLKRTCRNCKKEGTDNNNTESESVSSSLNNSIDSTESLDYSDIEDERSTFFLTK
ncbi:hypothetical protein TSAR_016292 [Trichomalopsis sarcophagae]|uniref:Uncharacterized protein n=1 Tax=Trichomalopsis sarcophagae TaxID=543379 RepID=A0A232EKG5_9HYME|nr:hypothetical protein TSAR_016292 [Trichomalopsis sarcophagae]